MKPSWLLWVFPILWIEQRVVLGMLSGHMSQSYADLAHTMLPYDPKTVRPNSTAAVFSKVVMALQSVPGQVQLALPPVKQEVLKNFASGSRPSSGVKRELGGGVVAAAKRGK